MAWGRTSPRVGGGVGLWYMLCGCVVASRVAPPPPRGSVGDLRGMGSVLGGRVPGIPVGSVRLPGSRVLFSADIEGEVCVVSGGGGHWVLDGPFGSSLGNDEMGKGVPV